MLNHFLNAFSYCHKEFIRHHIQNFQFSIICGPRKRQPKNWGMPLFVPCARYSLVKGERIGRFALSTRLDGTHQLEEQINSVKWKIFEQRLWDKSKGVPIAPSLLWSCFGLQVFCLSENYNSTIPSVSSAAWLDDREGVLPTYFCRQENFPQLGYLGPS